MGSDPKIIQPKHFTQLVIKSHLLKICNDNIVAAIILDSLITDTGVYDDAPDVLDLLVSTFHSSVIARANHLLCKLSFFSDDILNGKFIVNYTEIQKAIDKIS